MNSRAQSLGEQSIKLRRAVIYVCRAAAGARDSRRRRGLGIHGLETGNRMGGGRRWVMPKEMKDRRRCVGKGLQGRGTYDLFWVGSNGGVPGWA